MAKGNSRAQVFTHRARSVLSNALPPHVLSFAFRAAWLSNRHATKRTLVPRRLNDAQP